MSACATVLAILMQATAVADGGKVLLQKEAGGLLITLFSSPAAPAVGPVDISLLLQDKNELEPVLDADVSLVLHAQESNAELAASPSREQARNKLLYAATVLFPEPGKWRVDISVRRNGKESNAAGVVEVAPTPGNMTSYAGYIAFPPIMIMLFVTRERLIRRRSQR